MDDHNPASNNIAQSIHNLNRRSLTSDKSISTPNNTTRSINHIPTLANITRSKKSSILDNPVSMSTILENSNDLTATQRSDDPTFEQESDNYTSTISTPPASVTNRKTRSSSNKVQKLADIASNIIAVADSDFEDHTIMQISDHPTIEQEFDNPTPTIPKTPKQAHKNPLTPSASMTKRKTRSSRKTSNKIQKLDDVFLSIIAVEDSDPEESEDK